MRDDGHRRRYAISELTKRYGPSEVLSQVSFDVAPGEVVGLIGTNGAGKSTLIKILSGAIGASGGTVEVGGEPFAPATPLDARRAGIQTVHQEIDAGIVPGTTRRRQPHARLAGAPRRRAVPQRPCEHDKPPASSPRTPGCTSTSMRPSSRCRPAIASRW